MATKGRVLSLYRSLLRESSKFSEYNFRNYAKRRIKDAFNANKTETDPAKLQQLVTSAEENLSMMRRQIAAAERDIPVQKAKLGDTIKKTRGYPVNPLPNPSKNSAMDAGIEEPCKVCSGQLPAGDIGSCPNNSSSSLSDSVFSEDYTDMNDIDFKGQPSSSPLAHDHDADSCLSERSSVSTLENEVIGVEVAQATDESNDVERSSDDIQDASCLKKPDIQLTLGTPPLERKEMDRPTQASSHVCDSEDDDDHEFAFLGTEPVRRATSLKTYKTPPGTPGRKKAVRFADALGLDLEKVRHILNLEDPPTVPTSALRDLKLSASLDDDKSRYRQGHLGSIGGSKYLCACFGQPSADPGFMEKIRSSKVSLENCLVDDRDMTISGIVRVANIAYNKSVIIRYTINNWLTFEDVQGSYILNSNDGATDRFSFTINVPHFFAAGSKLVFCIMYSGGPDTYWDNNGGSNYIVECYARSSSIDATDNSWVHFI